MKTKVYLIEFVKGEDSELYIVRNPQDPTKVDVFHSPEELADFLRQDVCKPTISFQPENAK